MDRILMMRIMVIILIMMDGDVDWGYWY